MKFFTYVLLALAVLISGCCSCCISDPDTLPTSNPDTLPTPNPDTLPTSAQGLIGTWSTNQRSGQLYDPISGVENGDVFSGQYLYLEEDGSFTWIVAAMGQIVSGVNIKQGNFKVSGDEMTLYNIKRDWYPFAGEPNQGIYKYERRNDQMEDEIARFEFEDADTLVFYYPVDTNNPEYFHRQTEQ